MNGTKLKRIGSTLLIVVGGSALLYELASTTKNYYVQSIGIVCLMGGLFLMNTTLTSRTTDTETNFFEQEEE